MYALYYANPIIVFSMAKETNVSILFWTTLYMYSRLLKSCPAWLAYLMLREFLYNIHDSVVKMSQASRLA